MSYRPLDLLKIAHRVLVEKLHGIDNAVCIGVLDSICLLDHVCLEIAKTDNGDRCQKNRHKNNNTKRNNQFRLDLHKLPLHPLLCKKHRETHPCALL